MPDEPTDALERLKAIAEAHLRCAACAERDGWLVEGVSVRLHDKQYDKRCCD